MKIIVLGDELNQSRQFEFERSWLWLFGGFIALLVIVLLFFVVRSHIYSGKVASYKAELEQINQQQLFDRHEVDGLNTYAQTVFAEHARQAANLQARIARLEALGGQVADMAGLNKEFDFYSEPALGGPLVERGEVVELSDDEPTASPQPSQKNVLQLLSYMHDKLAVREHELKAIESLLENRSLVKERYLAGKPVEKGWLSSHFGQRTDPFTGKLAWHKGVDFAGKEGTGVLAVGSGLVTWSGKRYGYGQMVEITHGNGFVTRYGHNKSNTVAMGDVVTKGQVIARMGSTGRSTGPHVHFEVLRNGKAVDPARYIYRKSI